MPDIPLPTPSSDDIFSLGFDSSLNRNSYSPNQSPLTYSNIDNSVNGGSISSGSAISLSTLQSSSTATYVDQGSDIQSAIDTVSKAGGGKLFFRAGTYNITNPIILRSGVGLVGDIQSGVTINFGGSPGNFVYEGQNVYTTGTISSIAGGVTVTGNGTTWTTSMIGQQIFINNRWYVISDVPAVTTITLATGYADGATFSGSYRISTPLHDVIISGMTIRSSSGTAINATDVRDLILQDLTIVSNNVGYSLTNFMNISPTRVVIASSTSDGFQLTNGSFFNSYNQSSVSSGGNGTTLNNIKSCTFIFSACDSNTGDGINATSVTNTDFKMECSSNGGKGIQFVSGCNGNLVDDELINANTSDGIKLTATSSNNTFATLDITNNGGWGINIANSNCVNNIIISPYFSNNTSGNITDSGTGTTVFVKGDFQSFTSSGTWTKPSVSANSQVIVQLWGQGGGGGGSNGAGATGNGGGGGDYVEFRFRASDLTSTVSVTIGNSSNGGASGANPGTVGTNSTFGSYMTAYGGGGGGSSAGTIAGGGGGIMAVGQTGAGGSPLGGATGNPGGDSTFGGGGGGTAGNGGVSVYGGGGAGSGTKTGGNSVYGGGGGAGGNGTAGTSMFGGNGGASATNGSAPGGGGGGGYNAGGSSAGGNGGRGECRVLTIPA